MAGHFDVHGDCARHIFIDIPSKARKVTFGESFGAPRFIDVERCVLPLDIWRQIREPVEKETRRRMRVDGLSLEGARFTIGMNRMSLRLGRQVMVLAWAIEHGGDLEIALERWSSMPGWDHAWLYKQVVEQALAEADSPNRGWRRALKAALCNEMSKGPAQDDLFSAAA